MLQHRRRQGNAVMDGAPTDHGTVAEVSDVRFRALRLQDANIHDERQIIIFLFDGNDLPT